MMLKHVLVLIVLSIIALLFLTQFATFLHVLGNMHAWLSHQLLVLFSPTGTGKLISHVLALILIPLIVALIPAFIYWLIRRGEMPYLPTLLWVVWIMMVTVIALR